MNLLADMTWMDLTLLVAGSVLYIEAGVRLVRAGMRRVEKPIWPSVRIVLVLTWPLALIHGFIRIFFRR